MGAEPCTRDTLEFDHGPLTTAASIGVFPIPKAVSDPAAVVGL
jgi:hypothetical protein